MKRHLSESWFGRQYAEGESEALQQGLSRALGEAVAGAPSVRSRISVRTQHIGPEQLLVGCKVDFDDILGLTVELL